MDNSSSGDHQRGRQKGIIGWGVAAVLAVLLFGLLSLAQGARWLAPGASPTPVLIATPTPSPTAIGKPATPGVEAVAAALTPGWEPTTPAEATIQAVVLNVLANLPSATPFPTPFPTPSAAAPAEQTAQDGDGGLALWLSALTAITALAGLVSTLVLNWRKERREVELARAELAKTQLEVEKLRRELAA